MEKISKLQSEQGFTETAIPQAFITSKLLDFTIPGSNGVTYDLGKSYINVNMQVVPGNNALAAADGLFAVGESANPEMYNNDIGISTDAAAGDQYLSDCATLVRNATMMSTNKGQVESIRRLSTLRGILWNMENDKSEQHDGLDKFGSFQGRRGLKNETSSLLQVIGLNTRIDGTVDTTKVAQNLSRDFRIPLSDMFGVGSAQWNGDVYGDTRIHLELLPNLLRIQQLGGDEDTSLFDTGNLNTAFGAMESYDGTGAPAQAILPATTSLGLTGHPLISKLTYDDYGLNFPFHVGQAIRVQFTKAITGGATSTQIKYAIISELRYGNGDNNTNPPTATNQGSVVIVTKAAVHTSAAATETITNLRINGLKSNAATDQIRINSSEIVLSEMVGVAGPESIDYTTYTTEETQAPAGLLTFNKQVIVEPNAQNLIIASCAAGQTAPDREWLQYRLSIDNKDVAGNRDIKWGRPLHKDRIMRFFNNRAQNVSNVSLKLINQGLQQTRGNQIDFYPILETLPLTQESKTVTLELVSTAAATSKDIIFYKEIAKTI